MKIRNAVCLLFVIILCSCATEPQKPAAEKNLSIRVSGKFNQYNQLEQAVWMGYGMSLAACEKLYSAVSFDFEYCAREKVVDIWQELKNTHAETSAHFEDLEKIRNSGFYREYVWVNFYKPYWFKPKNIKQKKFTEWMRNNLSQHIPNLDPGIYVSYTQNGSVNDMVNISRENSGYPSKISGFQYESESHYADVSLGDSIRYRYENSDLTYMDIYMFPFPDKYQTNDQETLLVGLFSEAKAGIIHYVKKGLYSNYEVVEESYDENPENGAILLKGVYTVTRDNAAFYSTIYLCAINGRAVKFRITYPNNTSFSGSDHFKLIINDAISKLQYLN